MSPQQSQRTSQFSRLRNQNEVLHVNWAGEAPRVANYIRVVSKK